MQTEKIVNHIVSWLTSYAGNAKVNGFVVGISGGIDSAVASILCAKTGLDVLCIEMPIHQAETHVSRAKEHIRFLKHNFPNVRDTQTNLTPVFETFKSAVSLSGEKEIIDMALANTRARLRMTTLYYHAGIDKLLVAGTGNKVEDFGVGFYTKYGDGGVDLSPLADLMKSEVYTIGKYLEVPDSIINAAPSDGLFGDSRSDEDQIGASYPELEWAMNMMESGKKAEEFEGREHEVFLIFQKLNKANKHKMNPIPICEIPKILR
ncbi:NAD(+) synthase [Bizionia myxarmorum]|uniref:NH(3)-dependent NAD(+) synthetase n=1 Tax=Bizionia myxarmorum TaxID=291186 RepID=A0A5D0RA53_9FLAO|nr:NAD(+) synthase [Bizionia myxarmorum]TYB78243.1 NAD(+) synthase [Bizionia myxarmorum]